MFADWHWALFWRGGIAGLIIAAPAAAALLVLRFARVPPPALWGVLLAVAYGGAMGPSVPYPSLPTWGWAVLVIGLAAGAWLPAQCLQAVVAGVVLQIVLLQTAAIGALGDTGLMLAGLVPLAALAVASCDTRFPGLGPALLTGSLAGVYLAVPDTEAAFPLLGAALALAPLGAPLSRLRIGGIGAAAGVALLVWVVAVGSVGRPAAAVGAAACLGVLLTEPAARTLLPRRVTAGRRSARGVALLFGSHALLVILASRVVAPLDSVSAALAATLVLLTLGVGASRYLAETPQGSSCPSSRQNIS